MQYCKRIDYFHVHRITLIIFIFFVVQRRSNGFLSDSLTEEPKDKSICQKLHSVLSSRSVSYVQTYIVHSDYGDMYETEVEPHVTIGTRINFRQENFVQWELGQVCCDGYEPNRETEGTKCDPVCPSGCPNGKCFLPNVCICDSGYDTSINSSTKYSECIPNCPDGCHGGECIAPNKCKCHDGYVLDQGNCEPTCMAVGGGGPRGCGYNATCLAPNTCQCHEGYIVTTSPIRNTSMDIATKIIDKPVFTVGSIMCLPICNPECEQNAYCVAPNKCECNSGYRLPSSLDKQANNSKCLPFCEKTCVNALCDSPNHCTCHHGYERHPVESYVCVPICKNECINSRCTRPNHCECHYGYEKMFIRGSQHDVLSENVCVPSCPNCSYGSCLEPGLCICHPGYARSVPPTNSVTNISTTSIGHTAVRTSSQESCQPLCNPSCPNGWFCTAPNKCQLQSVYDLDIAAFSRNRTRIVHSVEDCGNHGDFVIENDMCICKYDQNNLKCTEPSICAIIFQDSKNQKHENLTLLQNIIFPNRNTTSLKNDSMNVAKNNILGGKDSMCTEECRVLISSLDVERNYSEKLDNCYQLNIFNATTGQISTRALLPSTERQNKTLICFMSKLTGSVCSKTTSKNIEGRTGLLISGLLVAGLLLIIGISFVIYMNRHKSTKVGINCSGSGSNGTITEQSEAMVTSFHRDGSPCL